MLLKRQPATDRYALMSRTTAWFLVFFGFTAFGFLNFEYRYLDDLANNYQHTFAVRMLEEMTGAYTGLVLFPLVVWLVRRTRIRQNNWSRTVPLNLLIMVGFSVCDTRLMSLSRSVLSPVFGLGGTITASCSTATRWSLPSTFFYSGLLWAQFTWSTPTGKRTTDS